MARLYLARTPEPRGIFERTFSPALDVVENAESYGVMCDLPGLDIKDVEISLSGNVLTIKEEKRKEAKGDGQSVFREEVGFRQGPQMRVQEQLSCAARTSKAHLLI